MYVIDGYMYVMYVCIIVGMYTVELIDDSLYNWYIKMFKLVWQ